MALLNRGPLAIERRELETSLTPSVCRRRLGTRTAHWFPWAPGRDKAVRGRVSERGFTLTKRIDHQNWFQTQAIGAFIATPEGTRITICFRPSLLAMFWFGGCFGWVLLIGSICVIAAIALPSSSPAGPIWYAGTALAMLLFLSFYIWLGRRLARDESAFLLQFVAKTLRAKEAHHNLDRPQTGDSPDLMPQE